MSWPATWETLRQLWDAARRKERKDVIVFTYVALDRLGGFSWRIRWRYDKDKPQWVGFRPFEGTHRDALEEAARLNAEIIRQIQRGGVPGNTGHYSGRRDDRDVVHKGPWDQCPACRRGIGGHPQ